MASMRFFWRFIGVWVLGLFAAIAPAAGWHISGQDLVDFFLFLVAGLLLGNLAERVWRRKPLPAMRFRLFTLMILLAVGPPLGACVYSMAEEYRRNVALQKAMNERGSLEQLLLELESEASQRK